MSFIQILKERGLNLTPSQINQFEMYYELLIEWNEKINLTAITEKDQVYIKHFYDSLTPCFITDLAAFQSICDVGSGAGFPSIPLKICFPHLNVSIVDALNKRIHFLETLVERLELANVQLYHDRAETFAKRPEIRESFDIVTARAVADLSILSEYCLPLVKLKGDFIAMKGSSGKEELMHAQNAISIMGGKVNRVEELVLPDGSQRNLIIVNKIKASPKKYPRKPGTPSKQPL